VLEILSKQERLKTSVGRASFARPAGAGHRCHSDPDIHRAACRGAAGFGARSVGRAVAQAAIALSVIIPVRALSAPATVPAGGLNALARLFIAAVLFVIIAAA
jgi:hypothetical protein